MATTDTRLSNRESSIAARYRQRGKAFSLRAAELSRSFGRIKLLRYVLAAIGGLAVLVAFAGSWGYLALLSAGATLAIVWLVCTLLAEKCEWEMQYADCLGQINEESLARMERNWERIPLVLPEVPESRRALAADLDLFGKASLYHLLCQAHTPWGIATLRDWLLAGECPGNLADRQQAVAKLAAELELRQEFGARGRLIRGKTIDHDEFVRWAEKGRPIPPWRPVLVWRIVYPAVTGILVALFAAGVTSSTAFGCAVLVILLVNLALSVLLVGPIHDLVQGVLNYGSVVDQYRSLFELLKGAIDRVPITGKALGDRSATVADACPALARLERLAGFARLARLPAVWLPIQLVTLWDFHVFQAIQRWRGRYGRQIPAWVQVLGEFEATLSLSAIAHDNPTWCFPRISEKSPELLRAEGLAHPLQRDGQRVGNDLTLGPRETVLFVTGSNMAGKSTLLRSIGTNIVLGQAGGPACATALEMSPVVLGTVFRVQDSLERGVSLYMTELLRLKEVVEQARAMKDNSGAVFLFLLDEILHGTNTAERHIAARSVILELLGQGACGAVSTHDLGLPQEAKLAGVSRNVHFSDQITSAGGAPKLQFDYRLRSGIAQSTNALRLLEVIGLKPDV